ncbi:MAG: hypothetical protein WC683_10410 [bacterium]
MSQDPKKEPSPTKEPEERETKDRGDPLGANAGRSRMPTSTESTSDGNGRDPLVVVAEIQARVEQYKADQTLAAERLKAETARAVAAETRVEEVRAKAAQEVARVQGRTEGIKGRYVVAAAVVAGLAGLVGGTKLQTTVGPAPRPSVSPASTFKPTSVKAVHSRPILIGSGTVIELLNGARGLVGFDQATIDLGSVASLNVLVQAHNRGASSASANVAPLVALSVTDPTEDERWKDTSLNETDVFYAVKLEMTSPLEVVLSDSKQVCGGQEPAPGDGALADCLLSCLQADKNCRLFSVSERSGTRLELASRPAFDRFFRALDRSKRAYVDLRNAGLPLQGPWAAIGNARLHETTLVHATTATRFQLCSGRWQVRKNPEPCLERHPAYLVGRLPLQCLHSDDCGVNSTLCDFFEALRNSVDARHGPILSIGQTPTKSDKGCILPHSLRNVDRPAICVFDGPQTRCKKLPSKL